jgi:hypothetical protein
MTIATSDEPSVGSSTAAATRPSVFLKPRRWRVDVIGAFALVLAAAGLVGSVVLLRTTPAALPTATFSPARTGPVVPRLTERAGRAARRIACLGGEGPLV